MTMSASMNTHHFQCTQCGRCCEGLWLPLSIAEALDWLRDGLPVDVLCEAIPWPADPPDAGDGQAAYKKQRSFAARSGALPIRVLVTLAAPQGRRCPRLQGNGLCGIYERRPAVCRVYPAEAHPLLTLAPERRLCPPEAWAPSAPVYLRHGAYVEPGLGELARRLGERAIHEIGALSKLCERLGIHVAAQANEGYVLHEPESTRLAAALASLVGEHGDANSDADVVPEAGLQAWQLFSTVASTVEILVSCQADVLDDEAALHQVGCRLAGGAANPAAGTASAGG